MDIHELFTADELCALNELGVNPQDLVFTHRPFLPFMKSRQYVCRLQLSDGLYSFSHSEKLPRRFKKRLIETEKQLLATNNAQIRKLMASARKNAEFVNRFNSELFFKHSFYKGQKLLVNELFEMYGKSPLIDVINLSSDADKQPFIALYAMAFYACTAEDIYTVDGIFSVQPERHADNAKKVAGNAVFNLLLRNNAAEIEQVLITMGKTLVAIIPPRVNLADMELLAKNYTLFRGLSEMGRLFCAVSGDPELSKAAQNLAKYAPIAALCEKIAAIGDHEDYRTFAEYKKCTELW